MAMLNNQRVYLLVGGAITILNNMKVGREDDSYVHGY